MCTALARAYNNALKQKNTSIFSGDAVRGFQSFKDTVTKAGGLEAWQARNADLDAKAAIPNLPDTQAGSADTPETSPSKRRRNYTSLFVGGNGTGANM